MSNRLGIAIVVCALSWAVIDRHYSVQAAQAQTVRQGVYTGAQAARGQAIYKERCASCHGDTLGGRLGPPLTGDDFVSVWSKEPLSELASKIRNTMPQTEPASLTWQQTADVVAYILQSGKFPAGSAELRGDEAALKQISWPAANIAQAKPAPTTAQAPSFPPAGNLAQVMRGILFPSSNIIFTVQTVDPGAKKTDTDNAKQDGGFNWMLWGADIYKGWELVDYAAVALAESAPLMLTPGRRCENGRPVPVNDPEWIKYSVELAEAGKAAYKASQSRNQEAVSDISSVVADACLHCHQVYRDRRGLGLNPADPSNKASRCTK
jgi:mono/diheme cytochrome c family protein